VPVLVTTAFEQVEYMQRAIDVGVDKFITKPVDTDRLERSLLDCARRLRAEELLEKERARELDAVRSHEREALALLAGGMAHDFNNLLQVVLANVGLAVPLAEPGTEVRELLEEAQAAAEESRELGLRLRLLSERWSAQAAVSPLGPLVARAVESALEGAHTVVHLALPPDLPAVRHDSTMLQQALSSIVLNAREAMRDGGALWVAGAARRLGPEPSAPLWVELTFSDQGPGLAPEVLPRVFDAYFSTKQRGALRGMGLGLALCRAIIRRHGGTVTAESPEGQGALLRVLLPAAL
jgi:signal transduction histidine kinase